MKTLGNILIILSLTAMQACRMKDPRTSEIDALCSGLFPEGGPGAAVLVLEKDKVIFEKGYGLADLETKVPIDGNTSFNIASPSSSRP